MRRELISVIIAVYNIEAYIEKCLRSVIDQTYHNLEIILVNDGSTDNSGIICHKFALTDSRIQVIDQENAGLSEARNAGLRIARGEYITFVDGDDYIDSQMYEKLYDRLIYDRSELALCNIRYVYQDSQCIDAKFDLQNDILSEKEFWEGYYGPFHIPYVVSWNKLYKREIFDTIFFDKGKVHEDEFILHKIVSRCKSISVIAEPLYYYVQRAESIMGSAYTVKRLQAIEACNTRLNYFADTNSCFINADMVRILGMLLIAKERLDFSVEVNRRKYKELKKSYASNFWRYLRNLNTFLILKSVLFLYCESIYIYLKKIVRKEKCRAYDI